MLLVDTFNNYFEPDNARAALAVLGIAAASAVLGVVYAIAQHDLKRLLAYHSVENIGIILIGLGSAVTIAFMNAISSLVPKTF